MNKHTLAVVASSLVLGACASVTTNNITWSGAHLFTAPNPGNPKVFVADDKYIVIDPDPIYVKQTSGSNEIYWSLGPGSVYYFPDDGRNRGIDWDRPPPAGLSCAAIDSAKTYKCTFNHLNAKKKYAYVITVTKDGTNFLRSDPTVMID
jgi:hypothetical protein